MLIYGARKATMHGSFAVAIWPVAETHRLGFILYFGEIQACYEL